MPRTELQIEPKTRPDRRGDGLTTSPPRVGLHGRTAVRAQVQLKVRYHRRPTADPTHIVLAERQTVNRSGSAGVDKRPQMAHAYNARSAANRWLLLERKVVRPASYPPYEGEARL
jgi:hypothetical protein